MSYYLGNTLMKYYTEDIETELALTKNYYILQHLQIIHENTSIRIQIESINDHIAELNKNIDEINKLINSTLKEEEQEEDDELDGPIDRENTRNVLDALRCKSLPAVKYYYQKNPMIIHKRFPSINGETLLHMASELGCLDIVAFLVSKGADIEATNDHWLKTTCLVNVPLNDIFCICKFLMGKKVEINYQGKPCYRPLHEIVSENSSLSVNLSIEMSVNIS